MKQLRQYNPGLLIPLVMLTAIAIVAALAWMAAPAAKAGFTRQFINQALQPQAALPKNEVVTAFAGTRNNKLYFATRTPNKFFVADSGLVTGHMESSGFTVNHPKAIRGFSISVTDSRSTLFAGNLPAVFTLQAGTTDSFNLTSHLYTRAVQVDSSNYVFRAFDPYNKKTRDQVLVKAQPGKGIIAIDSTTIPRLHDAGIGTDGMLHYDTVNKLLVFLSYYSNKVYQWNEELQLQKIARTIDTLSTQQYFTGEKKETAQRSTLTNLKPKRIINADSYVHNGVLYVRSRIKADNESNGSFTSNAVIDSYSLKDFEYTGSFYLPDYKGEKLWSIGIEGNSLLALYRNHIVQYDLPEL